MGLEATAEKAGRALACTFSCSAEYEAALIAERSEAGAYGSDTVNKRMLMASLAVAVALVVLVSIIA